jgi:flagellar biosynthesis GTPase FlhF
MAEQKQLDQTSSTQTIPRKSKKSKQEHYQHNSVQPRGTNLRVEELVNQMSEPHQPKKVRIAEDGYISGVSDDALRERIQALFEEEKLKMSQNLMDQCKDYIDSHGNTGRFGEDTMEEFYRFCKNILPQDQKYKESIMFVSLFYYFMEKKKHMG